MKTWKIFVVAGALLVLACSAFGQHYRVRYLDCGYAWRYSEAQVRVQESLVIENNYTAAITDADITYKEDADKAARFLDSNPDKAKDILDDAQQARTDAYADAEDRRITAYDSLYPGCRWDDCFQLYPDLFFSGMMGPCHDVDLNIVNGVLIDICFYEPYPNCAFKLFGWEWGSRHPYSALHTQHERLDALFNRLANQPAARGSVMLKLMAMHDVHEEFHQAPHDPVGHVGEQRKLQAHVGETKTGSKDHTKRGSSSRHDPKADKSKSSRHDKPDKKDDKKGG